jgi:hypothetical protein
VSELYAAVNGHALASITVTVGNTGPWIAECTFESDPNISGRVTITIGSLTLSGTVDPDASGTFAAQRKCRIVAGAGGWGSDVRAKGYHNDARIKAKTIAEDAAREVGESIGTFVPTAERVGVDYARQVGPASRVLEDVVGGAPWWVDYAGVTHVGPRASAILDVESYDVLAYDPHDRVVTLAAEDPSTIQVGSVISKNLDAPQTVRELELSVTAGDLRIVAWCGGTEAGAGHLAGLFRSIIERSTDGQLWGMYRYRVLRMAGDRVELQAVRKVAGLPDLIPVSMWPGVAGAHAELSPGAEVLVEFIEGDRTQPIVTHFAGKDGVGHVPVALVLCGGTQAAARQGDLVQCGGVGTVVTLVPVSGGGPNVLTGTPHLISFSSVPPTPVLAAPLYGAISTGSPKVKVG